MCGDQARVEMESRLVLLIDTSVNLTRKSFLRKKKATLKNTWPKKYHHDHNLIYLHLLGIEADGGGLGRTFATSDT